MSQPITEPY